MVAGRILLILQNLEIQQNWNFTTWHLWSCCSAKNWKSTKLHGVTFVKGTPAVSNLWEQQIVKTALMHAHFY